MPKKTWQLELGKQIKEAREALAMTQEELGVHVGTSRCSIYLYENGKGNPQFKIVAEIALILKTEFNVLGCRIAPQGASTTMKSKAQDQLELALDRDHSFLANVKIRPTRKSITITAHADYGLTSA